jgi:hypothetical protein
VTQLDLPQLSLQRYVDLVRRRRWQLVPISLLGLVVGAVVAFLIPRYYVAEASVEHQEVAGEMERGDNPFKRIVDNATETIRLSAGKAMEALNWPEAAIADPSRRTLEEKAVRERITVLDSNAGDKARTYAYIRIFYKDTDAKRAADFANALVDTWIAGRVAKLRSSHAEQLQLANTEFNEWDRTYEQYLTEKQNLEVRYRIRPDLEPGLQQEEFRQRQAAHAELRDRRRELEGERAARNAEVERLREQLATVPERTLPTAAAIQEALRVADAIRLRDGKAGAAGGAEPPATEPRPDAKEREGVAAMLMQLQMAQAGIDAWKEGTRERARMERDSKRMLTVLCAALGIVLDAEGKMPNPTHADLASRLAAAVKAAAKTAGDLQRIETELVGEERRLDDLAEGYRLLESKRKDLAMAEQKRADAAGWAQQQSGYLAALEKRLPVTPQQRATPPPRPTEPNILVVSLIGAVLGLGVAVGLILLLDLLQGTWKTSDEVERGLGVPVLGGMSHMETEVERATASRGRRRAGMAAFLATALVVLIVVVWYRAPTRLPAFVRDLMALLLGD